MTSSLDFVCLLKTVQISEDEHELKVQEINRRFEICDKVIMSNVPPPDMSSLALSEARPSPRKGDQTSKASDNEHESNQVSFVCQRCLQPLRIDPSFYSINEHVLAELTLPISQAEEYKPPAPPPPPMSQQPDKGNEQGDRRADGAAAKVDINVPHIRLTESGGNPCGEFTLVDEAGRSATLSTKMKTIVELFDLISNNSEIDHPLCEECTDNMLETMDWQLKLAEQEAQEYQEFLAKLSKETEDENEVESLRKELSDLELEENQLKEELDRLSKEEAKADEELSKQIEAKDKLEKEEEKYWREYSKYKRELLMAKDGYKSMDCKLRYTQFQLEKLKKMNVFNATFHIWHVGHFATINGFRLGRLPSVPVEWSEINAAWGHTAFLLSCLAKAIGMEEFQRYKLVPYGNYSYIKVLEDDKILPLYGTGGFRRIFDTKFDSAMVAFLDCLQQFANVIQQQGGFSLPYPMDKGKIKDSHSGQFYSIKLQFNSEDSWTKALRYMLTNLKWGLAYVSTRVIKQEGTEASGSVQSTEDSS